MSGYVGDLIAAPQYTVPDVRMPSTGLHVGTVVGGVELAPSGPDRPGDPLVPAYGGAIGYPGLVGCLHLLTRCLQYTAVCPHSAGRHVAQASSSVPSPHGMP